TRGGPRFFKALANAALRKPVIVLKGGRTQAGTRADRSHTGSLATTAEIWDALCQQAGAMQVQSLDEMLNAIETALYMKPPQGKRAGIIGWGGGASVMGTDACESLGLSIPPFSSRLRQELGAFGSGPGASVGNPVDSVVVTTPSLFTKATKMIAGSAGYITHAGEVDPLGGGQGYRRQEQPVHTHSAGHSTASHIPPR
ncbi:MAG: hypothetical protein NTU41_14960, partial [Chloroflexi bacterium]|nr:hypothetical protein [Chloroflexota bacterium]